MSDTSLTPGVTRSRRSLLAALGVGGAAALTGCWGRVPVLDRVTPTCESRDAPWPVAGRTPARTGHAPGTTPPAAPTPDRLLRHDGRLPPSTPVVGAERLFATTPSRLVAVDPADGTVAWEREPRGSYDPGAAPTLACGTVVASDSEGLAAFDVADGSRRWWRRRDADGRDPGGPAAAAGVVYVPEGERTAAHDAASGERLWTGGAGGAVAVDADAGRVYTTDGGASAGEVTALSTDGEVVWSTPGPAHLGRPVAAGDRVHALGEGELLALDAADGSVAWRRDGPRGRGGGLAVADGRVYAAAGGGTVAVARDAATGDPVGVADGGETPWRARTGGGAAAPVVAGDAVLVPGANGLSAVDARTGERRWRVARIGGLPSRSVAAVDGTVYAAGFDGVHALR